MIAHTSILPLIPFPPPFLRWPDRVTKFHMIGSGLPPRRFENLTLDEQAFIVARRAVLEWKAQEAKSK